MRTTPTSEPVWNLEQLEILKGFKEHLTLGKDKNISPFSDDAIIRYHTFIEDYDVDEVHNEVRACIKEIIQSLHHGRPSQVVILAGQAGMGKSHIINYFRLPEPMKQLDYVLVCNSNHWTVNEFDECLLNWLIDALTRQGKEGRNLLEEKMQEIAFQALQCILANTDHIYRFLSRRRRGVLAKIKKLFVGSEHVRFQQAVQERRVSIFDKLDFPRFASYVCDRFLAEAGNPFHRYLMHVLLRYLFKEDQELVLHWLRRAEVHDRFFHKLGVKEKIDRQYKILDAIQVLISLFTPEVSRGLAPIDRQDQARGKVFFLAFDQLEGRHELFDDEKDWFTFFAQLSELYNKLPNVFILFTMTLQRRDILHPQMEQQFRDRIRNDHRFILHDIDDDEVLAIYRKRLHCWLKNKPNLRGRFEVEGNPYLPFDQTEVIRIYRETEKREIRVLLRAFDEQFRKRLNELPITPLLDYETKLNEIRPGIETAGEFSFTQNHLQTIKKLLYENPGPELLKLFQLSLDKKEVIETKDGVDQLKLEFRDVQQPKNWVRIFLVQLPGHYKEKLQGCVDLLFKRSKTSNQLWGIRYRAFAFPAEMKRGKEDQIFERVISAEAEAILQAVVPIWQRGKANEYEEKDWQAGQNFLLQKVKSTYLGDLLDSARKMLQSGGAEQDNIDSEILD